jgi:hypothetical protein
MLPVAEDNPTRSLKFGRRVPIALAIPKQLRGPVLGIGRHVVMVLKTAVPKAPVDEDCDPLLREDEICTTTKPSQGREVNAVPQSGRMHELTNSQLGLGVR